jgi:hypothetical protein
VEAEETEDQTELRATISDKEAALAALAAELEERARSGKGADKVGRPGWRRWLGGLEAGARLLPWERRL